MALAVSLEDEGVKRGNGRAAILAKTMDMATGRLLEENKSPSRKTGELDNRGSHFYLCLYWAQAVASQTEDPDLAARYAGLARTLSENEAKIIDEMNAVQGKSARLDGYYHAKRETVKRVMRPSATFNEALAKAAEAGG